VRRVLLVLLLSLSLCSPAVADLAQRIASSVKSAQTDDYAVYVIKADSGTPIYNHNATEAMIPASNMKIITTAAAVRYLGPRFEYKTEVGLCDDTLVVVGSGDPVLGDREVDAKYDRKTGWVFDRIVQALRNKGIAQVNDIIVDTTVFDDQRVHPDWPTADLNRWYACEVCGLNYNTNCIEITVENENGRVGLLVEPPTSFVEITNEVRPITSGQEAVGAYRTAQPNKIAIRGKCKDKQGPFDVAIEHPAAFFGFLLAENLARAGITVHGRFIEKPLDPNAAFVPLTEFTTRLADCLQRANKDSLGLAAEALVKTIAAHNNPGGKNGSWERGRELIGKYLMDLGIPEEQFRLRDGSGLTRENRLSAQAIVTVLRDLYKGPNWEFYKASLAVAGEDGTVARYFKEAKYRSNILGKTGYISGVRSFCGICLTANGPYLFSILSNHASLSRDAVNDIAAALIDEYGAAQ
jgi:D-alanyl-D-alanine carboxypeptidase/D-alanyl-D-alanine-endopeptidase (penicillin-binding protein 4)